MSKKKPLVTYLPEPEIVVHEKKTENDFIMTFEDYQIFRQHAYKYDTKYGLLFDVICYGGLRVSEGIAIKPKDINFDGNAISVITLKRKGHPRIELLYPKEIIKILKIYIYGNDLPFNKRIWSVDRTSVFRAMKRILKEANLNPRHSPHALRHLHGTLTAEIVKDSVLVAKRLRHSSISATPRYIHLSSGIQSDIISGIEDRLKVAKLKQKDAQRNIQLGIRARIDRAQRPLKRAKKLLQAKNPEND